MTNEAIFLIVKKHIDEMDYHELLAGGAPKDEFDGESEAISARIRAEHSVREISEIIAEIFNSQFDEHNEATVFLSVAEKIKKDLPL